MSFLHPHSKRKPFPENVVPPKVEPIKVPANRRALSGLWWYSGWRNPAPEYGLVPNVMCRNPNPWRTILTKDRQMELGEYDEADPLVLKTQLEQVRKGGFDFVIYQIEHAHEHTNPLKRIRPALPDPLTMTHCADNHPVGCGVGFALSWWDSSATQNMWINDTFWQELITDKKWNGDDVRHSQQIFMRSVATRYMTHPDYLHYEGKPVFVRGHPQELQFYNDHFGVTPEEIIAIWQTEVGKAIGTNLHLIACAASPEIRPLLKPWGFTGLAEYLLHGNGWDNTMGVYRYWQAQDLEQCRRDGMHYIVPGTGGYDGSAENTPESQAGTGHMPTIEQLIQHTREITEFSLANYDCTQGWTIKYAANEIREGGVYLPMANIPGNLHRGDEFLRAHAAAVA